MRQRLSRSQLHFNAPHIYVWYAFCICFASLTFVVRCGGPAQVCESVYTVPSGFVLCRGVSHDGVNVRALIIYLHFRGVRAQYHHLLDTSAHQAVQTGFSAHLHLAGWLAADKDVYTQFVFYKCILYDGDGANPCANCVGPQNARFGVSARRDNPRQHAAECNVLFNHKQHSHAI